MNSISFIHSRETNKSLLLKKPATHRRRKETEAKANDVASVWGAKFIQFLAALAVLPRSI